MFYPNPRARDLNVNKYAHTLHTAHSHTRMLVFACGVVCMLWPNNVHETSAVVREAQIKSMQANWKKQTNKKRHEKNEN